MAITLTPISKSTLITVETAKTTVADFLFANSEKEGCKLYGIVDSAKNDDVFRFLATGDVKYRSLFDGTMDVQSFGVSGFLVECEKESLLFEWMTTEAWGDSCCIFFTSKSSFDEVFVHFQKFNRVYLEGNEVVLFRYYDPRVLRIYLPTCNRNETKTFFGEVKSFFAENEDPEVLDVYKEGEESGTEDLEVTSHKIILQ
ncbi:MAG: hypothetical protein DRJ05_02350 [Bacteroidetes bacterium]|nr:MAG: hypothetical protein DRJ05_02350 [Bacteroidota bacterium]